MKYNLPQIEGYELADYEAASAEEMRSHSHQINSHIWPLGYDVKDPSPGDAEALWSLVKSGEITTDLFLQDPTARTATLGVRRMRGQWDRARDMQYEIVGPESPLNSQPYDGELYPLNTPEAKQIYTVNWGAVSINGFAMLTRRRRMLETKTFEEKVMLNDGSKANADMSIEVDKLSTFLVDIWRLEAESENAAKELRLSIICGKLAMCNFSVLKRALEDEPELAFTTKRDKGGRPIQDRPTQDSIEEQRENLAMLTFAASKAEQYGITADEIMERIDQGNLAQLLWPESHETIENEIREPSGLLIPAMTTFYAARNWHAQKRSDLEIAI